MPGLLLVVVVGSVMFGLGTWRARVAPRIGAALLIIGGPASLLPISDIATLGGGLIVVYLAWVILGYARWSERPTPAPTEPPSGAHIRTDRQPA